MGASFISSQLLLYPLHILIIEKKQQKKNNTVMLLCLACKKPLRFCHFKAIIYDLIFANEQYLS